MRATPSRGHSSLSVAVAFLAAVAGISVALDYPPLGPVGTPVVYRVVTRCSRPANLDEAHRVLAQFLSPGLVEELRDTANFRPSSAAAALGKELRNIWGLWNGSPLRTYLLSLGVRHPEEMSELILVTFQRYLAGEPERVAAEVARLRAGLPPTPKCPLCVRGGTCTTARVLDTRLGRDRGFLVMDCCCALRPQILEGVVKTLPTGEVVVYPSMTSFVYDASCRNSFDNGSWGAASRSTTLIPGGRAMRLQSDEGRRP